MQRRNHFKQTTSLEDRLAAFAKEAREKALQLPNTGISAYRSSSPDAGIFVPRQKGARQDLGD
jgi:hypothetical protein